MHNNRLCLHALAQVPIASGGVVAICDNIKVESLRIDDCTIRVY